MPLDIEIKATPVAKKASYWGLWWARQKAAGVMVCTARLIELTTLVSLWVSALWIGFWLLFGDFGSPNRLRVTEVVHLVGENWLALVLVALLLFSRALRTFLERVEEAWGMKARPLAPEEGPTAHTNPDPIQGESQ